jgi:hypothetical protein
VLNTIIAAPSFGAETARLWNMLTGLALGLMILSSFACATHYPTETSSPKSQDRDGIRATLLAMNAGCEARDLATFTALFDDSVDMPYVRSDAKKVFHGKAAARDFMKQLLNLPFTSSFNLANVTFQQNGDAALIFVDGKMIHAVDKGKSGGKIT